MTLEAGLRIGVDKSEIMSIHVTAQKRGMTAGLKSLQDVDTFICLHSVIIKDGAGEGDFKCCTGKATAVFCFPLLWYL